MRLSNPIVNLGFLLAILAQTAIATNSAPCPRPKPGEEVTLPPELRSTDGVLRTTARFRTGIDEFGHRTFCYIFDGAGESPTLRLQPGDELILTLRNELPAELAAAPPMHSMDISGPCGGGRLSATSTNMHFHGLSIPPACHQDDVVSTIVPAGAGPYEYRIRIPPDHPPGLYWYHPHPHGFGEMQVTGGASGALIVEGIERVNPSVAGLPERIVVLRDRFVTEMTEAENDDVAGKDLSVNYVPIVSPLFRPAVLRVRPASREFWRVLNASADTYLDIQLRYGQIIQDVVHPLQLELIALDGSPLPLGSPRFRTDVLLPPGARAEFIAAMPPAGTLGQLASLGYDTGPEGDFTPRRTLINISPVEGQPPLPSLARPAQPLEAPQGLFNLIPPPPADSTSPSCTATRSTAPKILTSSRWKATSPGSSR